MASRVILFVADRIDPKRGEVSVLETAAEAERLMETLLEAGVERERLRAFSGDEVEARISHRPVVALTVEGPAEGAPPAPSPEAEPADDETPPASAPLAADIPAQETGKGASPLFGSFSSRAVLPELHH